MSGPEPSQGYAAATSGAAVFGRGHRTRLVVRGRAPGQMLDGILTGTLPVAPSELREGVLAGLATYHTVLTPKGKMVSDLWAWSLGDEETGGFLLDVPAVAHEGLLAHFGRYLPPRMAKVEDVSEETGALVVVGPEAAGLLSRTALGLRVEAHELGELEEGEFRAVGSDPVGALLVTRTADVWPEAFHVVGPVGAVEALRKALLAGGCAPGEDSDWHTLRVEAGRPAYGPDMDDGTIPVEAGVHDRAIDYQKGCYTGQEVIVRIRDRGHVNRSLQQLRLGDVSPPEKGCELFDPGSDRPERPVGWITSAARSPRFGETVALAYVRRDAERAVLGES